MSISQSNAFKLMPCVQGEMLLRAVSLGQAVEQRMGREGREGTQRMEMGRGTLGRIAAAF